MDPARRATFDAMKIDMRPDARRWIAAWIAERMTRDSEVNVQPDQLIDAAVGGDEDALSALLERHGPAIGRGLSISSKWRGLVEPDDVMQVTYLEAFLRIRDFKPTSPDGFSHWLRRIADNNLRDAIRDLEADARRRTPRPTFEPGSSDSYVALLDQIAGTTTAPSRAAGRKEIQQIVEDALRKLPPDYERVLRLSELEGKSGLEVATIMERSHGAVRMLLARAKDRLHELLGSSGAFFSDKA